MDPIDYFFFDEFFLSEDDLHEEYTISCPHCGVSCEIAHPGRETTSRYQCSECGGQFDVDWESQAVVPVDRD